MAFSQVVSLRKKIYSVTKFWDRKKQLSHRWSYFKCCVAFFLSCDSREENEVESFLNQLRPADAPWSLSLMKPEDTLEAQLRWAHTHKQHTTFIWSKCFIKSKLRASSAVHFVTRHLLSAGLDRRRQLGDIEFSNKYAEFLRSKAKHSSICSFLRRMQSVKMRCETWPHILTPLDTITHCARQATGLKCRDAPWWPNSPSR